MTPQEKRDAQLEMTHEMAEKLLAHESTKGMPVALNHRSGFAGFVTGGYIFKDALYHKGYIDESTPVGEKVASHVREGRFNNVSLTHIPCKDPFSLELSLCVGKGARPGSGIIHIVDDDSDEHVLPVIASEEVDRKRAYYLEQRRMVMASQEFQSEVVAEVPSFESPATTTPLVVTMSEPTAQPDTVAEPPKKSIHELFEEKMAMWDAGLRPDDARPHDDKDTYLMRLVPELGNMLTKATTARIMDLNQRQLESNLALRESEAKAQEIARKAREDMKSFGHIIDPLVKQFGDKANPPISKEEFREAVAQSNMPLLHNYHGRLLAVQASEESARVMDHHNRELERMQKERENLELRQRLLAKQEARDAEIADRERNRQIAESVYERTASLAMSQQAKPSPAAPIADRSGQMLMKAEDAHPYLRKVLMESNRGIEGMSDEDVRYMRQQLANPENMVAVLSTLDYLKKQAGGQYTPFKPIDGVQLKNEYISGICMASAETIMNQYPDTAQHLLSPLNSNLDKVSIPAMNCGYGKNPMDLPEFLASEIIVPPKAAYGSTAQMRWSNANKLRMNEGSQHQFQTVNGYKNGNKSLARAHHLQTMGHPLYQPRHNT